MMQKHTWQTIHAVFWLVFAVITVSMGYDDGFVIGIIASVVHTSAANILHSLRGRQNDGS